MSSDVYVIGEENTILGFALIGVDGEVVSSVDEARSALDNALSREGVKILLITEHWAAKMRDRVDELKMGMSDPLVLDIPGSRSGPRGRSLRELVEEAVGLRVGEGGS